MLSLDKAYSYKEVAKWLKDVCQSLTERILIMPKYDGISGKLKNNQLSTRGNGFEGFDVSSKLQLIDLPSDDDIKEMTDENGEVRGEIVCRKYRWDKYFSSMHRPDGSSYSNPRNFVAGILNSKEIPAKFPAKLEFVPHRLHCLTIEYGMLTEEKFSEIVNDIREHCPFPMDGIVFAVKDAEYAKTLGNTKHHPKHSIAYKFGNPSSEAVVAGVTWQVGILSVTPVIQFEPFELDGVMVTNATCHNYEIFKNADLHVGDVVIVERAGGVIPYISEVIEKTDGKKLESPSVCPGCGTKLQIINDKTLICTNDTCDEKILNKTLNQLDILGVKDLSYVTLKKIYKSYFYMSDKSLLENLLCHLTGDMCASLDRMGNKSAEKIITNLNNCKNTTPDVVVAVLGPFGTSLASAQKLLKVYPDITKLSELTEDDLLKVDGIGKINAMKYVECFSDNFNEDIKLFNIKSKEKSSEITDGENKMKLCFTGAGPLTRSELTKIATTQGYEVVNSVTKDLKILVTDDINSASLKTKKAKNIPDCNIITYTEFIDQTHVK